MMRSGSTKNGGSMKVLVTGLLFFLVHVDVAGAAAKIDVAYASIERIMSTTLLTEGGRRYLQGGPEDTCTYAFIQEPRVSAVGERLYLRFLFAGRAGKQVAGKCVGPGDNFDIIVSGVPSYGNGELFLDQLKFEADHKLFDVFSKLIENQLTPYMRIRAKPYVESYIAQLTTLGAGRVSLETLRLENIDLGPSSAVLEADFLINVEP